MPFESDAQRRLFHAAASDPAIAKKHGLTHEVIAKFIAEDTGDKSEQETAKAAKHHKLANALMGKR